jgi:hypothetical protein
MSAGCPGSGVWYLGLGAFRFKLRILDLKEQKGPKSWAPDLKLHKRLRGGADLENRGTDEKYTNGYVHYIAGQPFLAGYFSSVPEFRPGAVQSFMRPYAGFS